MARYLFELHFQISHVQALHISLLANLLPTSQNQTFHFSELLSQSHFSALCIMCPIGGEVETSKNESPFPSLPQTATSPQTKEKCLPSVRLICQEEVSDKSIRKGPEMCALSGFVIGAHSKFPKAT